jgi:hypothetical protein
MPTAAVHGRQRNWYASDEENESSCSQADLETHGPPMAPTDSVAAQVAADAAGETQPATTTGIEPPDRAATVHHPD